MYLGLHICTLQLLTCDPIRDTVRYVNDVIEGSLQAEIGDEEPYYSTSISIFKLEQTC